MKNKILQIHFAAIKVYEIFTRFKRMKEEKLFRLEEVWKKKVMELRSKYIEQNKKSNVSKISKISNTKVIIKNYFNELSYKFIEDFKNWITKYKIFCEIISCKNYSLLYSKLNSNNVGIAKKIINIFKSKNGYSLKLLFILSKPHFYYIPKEDEITQAIINLYHLSQNESTPVRKKH